MADNNIPIIEPTIDYTKVPPIHQKRTISFINHFVVNTVSSLNKLALTCEEKLFEFENKLQRVEAAVVILESRLASIPTSEEKPVEKVPPKENTEEPVKAEPVPVEEEAAKDVDETDKEAVQNETPIQEDNLQPITNHPLYQKYFKMLKVGVKKESVKQQMAQDGLDPELLEDPQRRVPMVDSESPDAS